MNPLLPSRATIRSRPDCRPVRLAACLLLAAAALPAQWSSNAQKNTFVDPCPHPDPALSTLLALDPVTVPCNNGGCFYAWIDANGVVNIQVIDDCGYRVLPTPYLVPGTGFGGGPVPLPTQIAGCAYANGDFAKNQLFLAYTMWGGSAQQLWGNVFRLEVVSGVRTIIPGAPVLLDTAATAFHSVLTPCVDSSVNTPGVNGTIVGAVVGWREWDFQFGAVTMKLCGVNGPAATPAVWGPTHLADSFTLTAGTWPPRLSVVSDHVGNVYGAWRGFDSSATPPWYHQGTRVDATGAALAGWPTLQYLTTRVVDDWVIAADLEGGVFFAQPNEDIVSGVPVSTTLWAGHNDGGGEFPPLVHWSNMVGVATAPLGQPIHPLAMVGIDSSTAGTMRAALAYRHDTGVMLQELSVTPPVLTAGLSVQLQGASPLATIRGCMVPTYRGFTVGWTVAVGWTSHTGNGALHQLYGQEVETTFWAKRWNAGNAKIVSENINPGASKHVPKVVSKYGLPEVIFSWVDPSRIVVMGTPLPSSVLQPGAYVQSVADDYVPFPGLGFKKVDGKLGSRVMCLDKIEHFDIHGYTFVSADGSPGPGNPVGIGRELLILNEADGTFDVLKDINPGPAGSDPSRTVARGSRRLFAATTAAEGREPWVTDGTTAGTLPLADCEPGPGNSSPQWMGGDSLGIALFSASSGATGRELWRTDGTPAGTAMVLDLRPGSANGVISANHGEVGGHLYFWGNDGLSGIELWRTDGTSVGTTLVADLSPGSANTGAGNIAVLGNRLVFGALLAGLGAEPYALDPGTNTVTPLGDLAPGASSSGPSFMTRVGGLVYFSASDAAGRELWCTDGTPAGTVFVADIHPAGSSNPRDFVDAGGYALFTADDGVHGEELWRTDGTPAGTSLVADVLPGNGSGSPMVLTALGNGRVAFSADDGTTGREPWVTDGTPAGTLRVADVNPGAGDSTPDGFDVVAGVLWFGANDGTKDVTVQLELDGPVRFGQGCPGSGGLVPSIGASGTPHLGQSFNVSLADGYPNSAGILLYHVTSTTIPIGGCAAYVTLPELGSWFAFMGPAGTAAISVAVPNAPVFVGVTLYWQWAVIDPAGPVFGFSLSDGLRLTIE